MTRHFTPTTRADARGRNGWFRPDAIHTTTTSWEARQNGPIRLEVWSKRTADVAPILLHLSIEDAEQLAAHLRECIEDARLSETRQRELDARQRATKTVELLP